MVTLISLVRGRQRWVDPSVDWLSRQAQIIEERQVASTWLLDYDALGDKQMQTVTRGFGGDQEIGLFMEVTESLAIELNLPYDKLAPEHAPGNAFLSGYTQNQRRRIIDRLVEVYRQNYGKTPESSGAWFIDSWSLGYLNREYGIDSILLVAEQYGTDQHTIRGHVWQAAYYPDVENSLKQGFGEEKLESVVVQWAVRQPLLGYGYDLEHSNFSVQANDYTQKGLGGDFFRSLYELYLFETYPETLRQLTLGIEVGQEGAVFEEEFAEMLTIAKEYTQVEWLKLSEFGEVFEDVYPQNPSLRFVEWGDKTTGDWAGWITAKDYRMGLVADEAGVRVRDLRDYRIVDDDSWQMADKRRKLFRQVVPIVDEVGLGTEWQWSLERARVEVVGFDEEGLQLEIGGQLVRFGDEGWWMEFEPVEPKPEGVIGMARVEGVEYSVAGGGQASEGSPSYWLYVFAIGMVGSLIGRWWSGENQAWKVGMVCVVVLGITQREVWLLTPLNDLGLGYLTKLSGADWWLGVFWYVIWPVLFVVVAVSLYRLVRLRSRSQMLGMVAVWLWLVGSSWGWVLANYRGLPVDVNEISGVRGQVLSWVWPLELGLSRLQYGFSAGAMNIEPVLEMVRFSWVLIIPVIVFVVMNLGVLVFGYGWLVWKSVTRSRWLSGLGLIGLVWLYALSVNAVDVRLPTVLDLVVRLVAIVGLVELMTRVKLKKHWLAGVCVVLVGLSLPDLVATWKRNQEMEIRAQEFSDRSRVVAGLESETEAKGVFVDKFSQTNQGVLIVPMGIEDYYFVDPMKLKQKRMVETENSYVILVRPQI